LGEKHAGVPFREKFRIRFYNHDTSKINLENKIKRFQSCLKLSSGLTKDEVCDILNGEYGFLKEAGDPLKLKFYRLLTSEGYIAKTITDYTRAPFVCALGNVRITIDSDLRSPTGGLTDIFNPNSPTVSIFPDGRCILEIKYDEYIPEYIYKLVQQFDGTRTAGMSKYAVCRRFL
ncbi:MAG: polyphosphate polymerase domain-containing protein, partial [Oscillospiraceae bacterium]|nr:polyphosphate polymerase domain-containing protein [Oscillospiraceae bacterium]